MFYKKGIDITNDRQMFNFLKEHFTYYTGNSWNRTKSIANNVKLYRLDLSGSWTRALSLLECGEYEEVNWMIQDWEREHSGYKVYFNGRSGGYLVLYNKAGSSNILPDTLDYDTYEEYKADMRDYYGSVRANRNELVFYVKLVQDFDKLCDQLRDYCDELSKLSFEVVEMQKSVDEFNNQYSDDLEYLGFEELSCDAEGKVDVSELIQLKSLYNAFYRIANRSKQGYLLDNKNNIIYYKSNF